MTTRVCPGLRRLTRLASKGVIGGAGGAPGQGDDRPPNSSGSEFAYASQASLLQRTKGRQQRTTQNLLDHFPGGDAGAALDEIEPACGILAD